jgi:hypothetical protein
MFTVRHWLCLECQRRNLRGRKSRPLKPPPAGRIPPVEKRWSTECPPRLQREAPGMLEWVANLQQNECHLFLLSQIFSLFLFCHKRLFVVAGSGDQPATEGGGGMQCSAWPPRSSVCLQMSCPAEEVVRFYRALDKAEHYKAVADQTEGKTDILRSPR